jgi:hypothetical protein
MTWSDERAHVLDEGCWCGPVVDAEFGSPDKALIHLDLRAQGWSKDRLMVGRGA